MHNAAFPILSELVKHAYDNSSSILLREYGLLDALEQLMPELGCTAQEEPLHGKESATNAHSPAEPAIAVAGASVSEPEPQPVPTVDSGALTESPSSKNPVSPISEPALPDTTATPVTVRRGSITKLVRRLSNRFSNTIKSFQQKPRAVEKAKILDQGWQVAFDLLETIIEHHRDDSTLLFSVSQKPRIMAALKDLAAGSDGDDMKMKAEKILPIISTASREGNGEPEQ